MIKTKTKQGHDIYIGTAAEQTKLLTQTMPEWINDVKKAIVRDKDGK